NTSRRALTVVLTRCSGSTLPASSSTQHQLLRSPRSSPTVNFSCEIFLLVLAATVLTFFIAGLLYLLCLKHVDNLGAYSIPSGDRPSHPIWYQQLSERASISSYENAVSISRTATVFRCCGTGQTSTKRVCL